MTNTKLAVTVEPRLRKKAEKVLDELGLDLDSAVRVFLKKVVATHAIPFALAEEPPPYRFTPAAENEILAAAKSARDPRLTSDSFDTADALVAHLRQAKAGRFAAERRHAQCPWPRNFGPGNRRVTNSFFCPQFPALAR